MSQQPNCLFNASNPEELGRIGESLLKARKQNALDEQVQMTRLLEQLANTDILQYPISVLYTGENAVPDFQLQAGLRCIAVETAKLTSQNWEHAISLQRTLPPPPTHYDETHLVNSKGFFYCLKASIREDLSEDISAWPKFVMKRLPSVCREWLAGWNGGDAVPKEMIRQAILTLNGIIDGPPIAGDSDLQNASPKPELFECDEFTIEERPGHRKKWLDEAFRDYLAHPCDGVLMDGAFMSDSPRMKRQEVMRAGFVIPVSPNPLTIEKRDAFWIERFRAEINDKSKILSKEQFVHGDEDWLLLWDRLRTPEWRLGQRGQDVSSELQSFWATHWFSRVFIQDYGFRWLLMFTATGVRTFPSDPQ
jgi:hypothetical protein